MRTGKILGISGPTVSVDLKGLKLYERVFVGHSLLTGEVVRLERTPGRCGCSARWPPGRGPGRQSVAA